MNRDPQRKRLDVKDVGDVTLVRFLDRRILAEQDIQIIGEQLFGLVENLGRRQILLDFSAVEFFSSAAAGKLIALAKKVQAVRGKLAFCGIDPEIYEVFEITRLEKFFGIIIVRDPLNDSPDWLGYFRRHVVYACPAPACAGGSRTPDHRLQPVYGGERCPVCALAYWPALERVPVTGEALVAVRKLMLPTYDREGIEADLEERLSTLAVLGRMDLFAFDALKRLWELLPLPQRIVCDLNRATEVSEAAARAFLDLALRDGQGPVGLVADETHGRQAAAFGNRLVRFLERWQVSSAFTDGPALDRPMIKARVEE
jgi:anti-sigma B factor antagonist